MTHTVNLQSPLQELAQDLNTLVPSFAQELHIMGYQKARQGEWQRDTTYPGKAKQIFRCSLCNYWTSVKTKDANEKLRYMLYCPYCGARMTQAKEEL